MKCCYPEDLTVADDGIVEYLSNYCQDQLQNLLEAASIDQFHDFRLDLSHFFNEFPSYFTTFFENPNEFLAIISKSLIEAQKLISPLDIKTGGGVKELLIIRLKKVPFCPEIYKDSLSGIDVASVERLVIVPATVIRVGSRRSLEKQKVFRCCDCQAEYLCFSDPSSFNRIEIPLKCSNSVPKTKKMNPVALLFEKINKKQAKNTENNNKAPREKLEACGGKRFEPLPTQRQFWLDYQEIKVQETFKTLKPGTIPKTLWVILEGSLVDSVKPGEDVILTGVLRKRWKKLVPETRPEISLCLTANSVSVKTQEFNEKKTGASQNGPMKSLISSEEEFEMKWLEIRGDWAAELRLRNLLIQSVCPEICGKFEVKLAILLTIIGGVTRIVNNTRVRGQCHLLLIGEPGTGKSQFLKFAQSLSPRAVFTNGIGSSSAGLTVACVKEAGDWMLEAGALVLSDRGICCIDEFNLMKATDFVAIHEAMEQQTISVAKAGLTMRVNARTTIIAACNPLCPGQKYQEEAGIVANSGLNSPLISRFDLIFILVDEERRDLDERKCEFILRKFEQKGGFGSEEAEVWEAEDMKEYIQCVRRKCEPFMVEEAQKLLTQYYYNHLRRMEMQGKATIRALESLVRLSQAHARLMFRDKVEICDAICVILLMENAAFTGIIEGIDMSDLILLDEEKYNIIKEKIEEKFEIS